MNPAKSKMRLRSVLHLLKNCEGMVLSMGSYFQDNPPTPEEIAKWRADLTREAAKKIRDMQQTADSTSPTYLVRYVGKQSRCFSHHAHLNGILALIQKALPFPYFQGLRYW